MRIQHNIMAMNAYRNYNNNNKSLSGNLEKLSSGYKINRAGDDAAGLAISEKMRAQITGLDAAQKNVKDGISLVKTAEGAMQEIQDMLNRMDYLATQSANGTYDNEVDRANLNKEVTALKSEINRIADSANFNGIKLLDGTWAKEVTGGTDEPAVDPNQYDYTSMKTNSMTKATIAASIGDFETADGHTPTDATKATVSIKLKAGVTLASLEDLKNISVTVGSGTMKLGDLFDITVGEEEYDSSNIGTNGVTDKSVKITLTSKVAGNMGTTTMKGITTALSKFTGFACASPYGGAATNGGSGTNYYVDLADASSLSTYNGTNEGEASDAGKTDAVYKVTVDLAKLQGGAQLSIGGSVVKFDATTATSVNGTVGMFGLKWDDIKNGDETAVNELISRIETAMSGFNGAATTGGAAFEYEAGDVDGTNFTFTLTDANSGTAGNVDKLDVSSTNNAFSIEDTAGLDGPQADAAGNQVQVSYKWTPSSLKAGDVIQIGGKYNIELVDDKDWEPEMANKGKINLKDFKEALAATPNATTGSIDEVAELLNKALMNLDGKASVQVSAVNGSNITLQSREAFDVKAEEWAKGDGQFAIGKPKPPVEEPDEPEEPEDPKGGKTLTLQIGDTADKFNQLGVNIGDMHTNAMGTGKATIDGKEVEITETIDDIDISTQEGAQKAIYSIRNAINTVSSVRGDLGAVQNRLDHTANNLSVMAENIQDAESTIRDTDVANEMMSYVKNNILVQSAQAMLAQANQVPQGVLQLLG